MLEVGEIFRSLIPDRVEAIVGGVSGVLGAWVTILYGEWTDALDALVIAMVIDYVTGVLAAGISPRRSIDYKVGAKGLAKKLMILLIVSLGHLADYVMGSNIICLAITYGYLSNEGLSILANAEAAAIPVPNVVKMAYHSIGEKSDVNLTGKKRRRE